MKRRDFLGGSAGVAAGMAAAVAGATAATVAPGARALASELRAADMAPAPGRSFVFVPGTWHGGWMWRHLRRPLWLAGHEVFTPTITGVGERSHLMSPEVGLETHIQDIVNVIEFEELEDVILVGHSFAGITITGVADRLRERIGRLVFFDALVPTAARPAAIMPDPETGAYPAGWQARMRDFRDGYQMGFFDHYPVEMLVPAEDEENIAWVKRRLTTHPARQWTDPLQLRNGGWEGLPRTYIRCTGQVYSPSSDNMGGPALTEPGWDLIEFPYPRSAMMTHPAETVALMLAIAKEQA